MRPTIDLNVVLVRPLYSRNVGYVSRVMANMGANRLFIIDSKCDYDLEARQGAAGAQTHIMQATHYQKVDEFLTVEPEGLRVAFCGRSKKETDSLPFNSRALAIAKQLRQMPQPLYLFFGPEDHGLENEDLEYAHFICALPTYGEFVSLNLSHAVMLAMYVLREAEVSLGKTSLETVTTAPRTGFDFPKLALNEWLNTLGFETGDRRTDAYKVLKRILLNNQANAKELRILEAIVNQTVRKLGGCPSN